MKVNFCDQSNNCNGITPHQKITDDDEHEDYQDASSTGDDGLHPSGGGCNADDSFSDNSTPIFGPDGSTVNNRIDYDDTDADTDEPDNDTANNNLDHVNTDAGTNESEHGRILTREEILESQQESWVEPTIKHYPGNRAGEVCSKGIAVMQECENALGARSENAYFPFNSKIDWELAKWAKLRGPSATSFTELLNVSGVSAINIPLSASVSCRPYLVT